MIMIKKYIWVISFSVVTLISLIILIFFALPNFLDAKDKNEQASTISLKNQALLAKLLTLNTYSLSDLEEKYQLSNIGLMPSKDAYRIFSFFENALSQIGENKLKFGSLQFEVGEVKAKQNAKSDDLVLSLDVRGEATATGELIKMIETSYPLMTVKSIDAKFKDPAAVSIALLVHIFPEVSQIPSLETQIGNFSNSELKLFEAIAPISSIFQSENDLKFAPSGRTDPFAN